MVNLNEELKAFEAWCIASPDSMFYKTAWQAWIARARRDDELQEAQDHAHRS